MVECWSALKLTPSGRFPQSVVPGLDPRLFGALFEVLNSNILLYKAHGIDSTQLPTFGDVTGAGESKAVRQHNSVFHSILKFFPWDEFDRAIEQHDAEDCARGFSHRSHLVAMLYAQFAGSVSLRDIEAGLSSHANRLYHVHATAPKRATLAEANRDRPVEIFADLLAVMIQRSHRKLRQSMDGVTYLIDSTGLALNALSSRWAQFSAKVCGAKLHVVYDPNADCPVYTAFSPANVNDITAAKAMPIVPKATYVFDLGYYDYAWWADARRRRMPDRHPSQEEHHADGDPNAAGGAGGGAILSDQIGYLPARLSSNRQNPFSKEVREVRVRIPTGKILRILTNDLEASVAGDRRPLQAALGDRAVLPVGQTDASDQEISRRLRKRRAHPDHRRADRLPAAAAGAANADRGQQSVDVRPPRHGPISCICAASESFTDRRKEPKPCLGQGILI